MDSSTQSTKVELRDLETGRVVARGSAPHPATAPPISEQDPRAWWRALKTACAELGELRKDTVAMSVGGQQHGLVLLDSDGTPVRPAKLWNDTTSAPQATMLVDQLGADAWANQCGSVPVAAFTITKLAWLAANEPEALTRTARVMLPHDYLTWRLTDRHVTDRGDASGTGWFDPATGSVVPSLLGTVVDDPQSWLDRLPEVVPATQAVGTLTGEAAAALGLPAEVLVGVGSGDNMLAALGLGLGVGDVAMSLGTSGTVYSVSSTSTADPSGSVAGFAFDTTDFLPLVCTLNATKVTDTVARLMGTDAAGLSELACEATGSPADLVLVPYFDGERTPNLPDATGRVVGMTTTTTREELARAAHDGVLCGLLDGLDALRSCGVAASGRLHLIGGGAKSAAYRQRCADLHGSPITVPDIDETVATGAALQAARLISMLSPAEISAAWSLGGGETVEPSATAGRDRTRAAYADAIATD